MSEPRMTEELERMKNEYEPLLPAERKLIWYTFGSGVVLLTLFIIISRVFF